MDKKDIGLCGDYVHIHVDDYQQMFLDRLRVADRIAQLEAALQKSRLDTLSTQTQAQENWERVQQLEAALRDIENECGCVGSDNDIVIAMKNRATETLESDDA